jgi:hypothetical protein
MTHSLRACTLICFFLPVASTQGFSQTAAARVQQMQASEPQTKSIATSILRSSGSAVHILYLHGIAATGANDSAVFRQSICDFIKKNDPDHACSNIPVVYPADHPQREFANTGPFSPDATPPAWTYLGKPVWQSTGASADPAKDKADWQASRPFVDHYVLQRLNDAPPIFVDDINWWPLVLLPKCRNIMANEAFLAGPTKQYLDICAGITTETDPAKLFNIPTYPFISQEEARLLEQKPSPSASLNHGLKANTMDWGLSDATLAVGPLHWLLMEAIQQLLVRSVEFDGLGQFRQKSQQARADSEYIFVSHSLGSYLIFSALEGERPPDGIKMDMPSNADVDHRKLVFPIILTHASQAYFFANQVALLELADFGNTGAPSAGAPQGLFHSWIAYRQKANLEQPQIIAWSDPSDILSWWVPQIDGISVQNIPIKNAIHLFGFFENPLLAHDNYAKNKKVLQVIFKQKF